MESEIIQAILMALGQGNLTTNQAFFCLASFLIPAGGIVYTGIKWSMARKEKILNHSLDADTFVKQIYVDNVKELKTLTTSFNQLSMALTESTNENTVQTMANDRLTRDMVVNSERQAQIIEDLKYKLNTEKQLVTLALTTSDKLTRLLVNNG